MHQDIGSIVVQVPLKTTSERSSSHVQKIEKPEFETAQIVSVADKVYSSTEQMEIAKFISEYYFSFFWRSNFLIFALPRRGRPMPSTPLEKYKTINPIMVYQEQDKWSPKMQTHRSAPTLTDLYNKKLMNKFLKKERSLLFGVTGSGKTEIFISLMFKDDGRGKNIYLFDAGDLSYSSDGETFEGLFWGCCGDVAF